MQQGRCAPIVVNLHHRDMAREPDKVVEWAEGVGLSSLGFRASQNSSKSFSKPRNSQTKVLKGPSSDFATASTERFMGS